MKIHFERTGGFAGIPTAATIDTLALTPEEAQQLHDLIRAAAFSKNVLFVPFVDSIHCPQNLTFTKTVNSLLTF